MTIDPAPARPTALPQAKLPPLWASGSRVLFDPNRPKDPPIPGPRNNPILFYALSTNLIIGIVVYAAVALIGAWGMFSYLLGSSHERSADWGGNAGALGVSSLAAYACFLVLRRIQDGDRWDHTGAAMKWFAFLITPWGLFAGLGVGVIVVGLMVLMGAGGGSSGGSFGGRLSYQEKKDIRESVEWGVKDAIRKS